MDQSPYLRVTNALITHGIGTLREQCISFRYHWTSSDKNVAKVRNKVMVLADTLS